MIVAGGAGSRLAPLTDDLPKPLLPLVGMPFLAGLIARLHGVGVDRVLIVAGADPRPFTPTRAWAADLGLEVEVVPEPTPLDTAGGVRSALDRVDGPFLVLNGDVLMDLDLPALFDHHLATGAVATLALTKVPDTSTFGVCVLEADRIVDFVEKPPAGTLPGHDTVNAGAYVLDPTALASYPQGALSFEREVFPGLVAAGQVVSGFVSRGVWADLGTPSRYLDGHRLVLDGRVPWPTVELGASRTVAQTAEIAGSAHLEPPTWIGASSVVAADCHLGPHVVLGESVRIGPGARVADAVLHDGVVVDAEAVIDGAILGTGSQVGDRAQVGTPAQEPGGRSVATTDPVVVGPGAQVPAGTSVAPGVRVPGVAR